MLGAMSLTNVTLGIMTLSIITLIVITLVIVILTACLNMLNVVPLIVMLNSYNDLHVVTVAFLLLY
jgi:hypothetical protein